MNYFASMDLMYQIQYSFKNICNPKQSMIKFDTILERYKAVLFNTGNP